jgi:hypothetical protein
VRVKLGALIVAVGLAGALASSLVGGSDEPDRAAGSVAGATDRSRAPGGYARLIAALPEVGRLSWRCDDEGRSSTTLALPRPGGTVSVSVESDGRRLFRAQRLDPPDPPEQAGRLATPFQRLRRQSWKIRYEHPPAPTLVDVHIRFARNRVGECFVPRATTDVRTIDKTTP